MEYLELAIKAIVGLSIINVWLFRFGKATPFRGGNANNMREEFEAYGLPIWVMGSVGTLKVAFSAMLIASIWLPVLETIPAMGIAVLMLGAIVMHLKIGDPIKKSYPAATFLVLSVLVLWL